MSKFGENRAQAWAEHRDRFPNHNVSFGGSIFNAGWAAAIERVAEEITNNPKVDAGLIVAVYKTHAWDTSGVPVTGKDDSNG